MVEQIKKNPGIDISAPSDLLEGFKKKRDFIMSFRNGHHKSMEQCESELKKLFNLTHSDA